MSDVIKSVEDYAAAMQLIHEMDNTEWCYDEQIAREWLVDAMVKFEEKLGNAFASELGADVCYDISEVAYNKLPDGNVYQTSYCGAWLHYRAMRYAGLSDIPF